MIERQSFLQDVDVRPYDKPPIRFQSQVATVGATNDEHDHGGWYSQRKR